MRLSTSSSRVETLVRKACAMETLFLMILFFVLIVLTYEAVLRWNQVGLPNVRDDFALWSMEREKVDDLQSDANAVLLLGGSRMQLGFSRAAFEELYPDRPLIRLGVSGAQPLATLIDIADNTNFNGTLIMSLYTLAFSKKNIDNQKPYVQYYHGRWNLNQKVNRKIQTYLETRLVSKNYRYSLVDVMRENIFKKEKMGRHYLYIDNKRGYHADYSIVEEKRLKRKCVNKAKKPKAWVLYDRHDEWIKEAKFIEEYVQKIQDRGGRVVIVRFPIDYDVWLNSFNKRVPKEQFWDVYAAQSSAQLVHFADYEELQFSSPDCSHLDMKDAPAFTRNLLTILEGKGVF